MPIQATKAGTAWLITNHSPQTIVSGYKSILAQDIVIAIDKGYEYARLLGLKPALLIGDLDSLAQQWTGSFEDDLEILRYQAEKNETDTELAIQIALERGFREIVICNDLGGRFDHAMALVQNLSLGEGAGIRIESSSQVLFLLGEETVLNYPAGSLLSLIALTESAEMNGSKGLYYPLDGLILDSKQTRGISNRLTESGAWIGKRSGRVLAIVTIL